MKRTELIELIREEVQKAFDDRGLNEDSARKKKQRIIKRLKQRAPDLKERYGDQWKSVMHGTVKKMIIKSDN